MILQPTWSQSFHYAFQSEAYVIWAITAIAAFMATGWYIVKLSKTGIDKPIFSASIIFGLMAYGLLTIYIKPGTIHWENQKAVTAQQYEKYKGNTQSFFDSVYNDCRLIGAAHNCNNNH
jgi:hypothetical protein